MLRVFTGIATMVVLGATMLQAQYPGPGQNFSPNVHLVSHVPLAGEMKISDIEVEQELTRPYA